MAIYFLRHGESEANITGLFAGQKNDAPLSKLGVEQARKAGEEFKQTGVNVNSIITSKLKRAYQTAEEMAKAVGFNLNKIETDDRLLEYDMGSLTGTPIHAVSSRELTSAGGRRPVGFS